MSEDGHPIAGKFLADMEGGIEKVGATDGSNDQRFAEIINMLGEIVKATGHAIAALESEIILLRQVVHGDDPTLRLHRRD